MRTLHLFGGLAGGLFADLILGHTPVCYVDLNPDACRIVRGMVAAGWFPGLVVVEQSVADQSILGGAAVVAGFNPAEWEGRVDCLSAGFPCQDLSLAGKGAGIHGKRSGLYREAIRCIEAIRPAYVLLENVPAIVSRGRHVVIADLVALGYSWRDGILSASDVGAPHLRKRWWCLGKRSDVADPHGDQCASGQQVNGGRLVEGNAPVANGCTNLANPLRTGLAQREPIEQSRPGAFSVPTGGGWWDAEPAVRRVAHGIPNREHRLRGLGNAQVPLCAAAAWRILGGT